MRHLRAGLALLLATSALGRAAAGCTWAPDCCSKDNDCPVGQYCRAWTEVLVIGRDRSRGECEECSGSRGIKPCCITPDVCLSISGDCCSAEFRAQCPTNPASCPLCNSDMDCSSGMKCISEMCQGAGQELVVWGLADGAMPSRIKAELEISPGIAALVGNGYAFAAYTIEGRWFAWGTDTLGGELPQATQERLEAAAGIALLDAGCELFPPNGELACFTVVTTNGVCYAWGSELTSDATQRTIIPPGSNTQACADALARGVEAGGARTSNVGIFAVDDAADSEYCAWDRETSPGCWTWNGLTGPTGNPEMSGFHYKSPSERQLSTLRNEPIVMIVDTTQTESAGAYAAVVCRPGYYAFNRIVDGSTMCYAEGSCGPGFEPRNASSSTTTTTCARCPPGLFSAGTGACAATCGEGQYCGCDAGTYSSYLGSSSSSDCRNCPLGEIALSAGSWACYGNESSIGSRQTSTSTCQDGLDVDVSLWEGIEVQYLASAQPCIDCPHKLRCPGVGNCSEGATGNLCGSCKTGFFNLGPVCGKCSGSIVTTVLLATAVVIVTLLMMWRFTAWGGATATEIHCVMSFGSKKSGYEVAVGLKQKITAQFGWPDNSVYMDCDTMKDKLGTARVPVTDEDGTLVLDEEGKVVGKSRNDDWHVFFLEANGPAMLFSLTQSWVESPYCRTELVWYLVLKTMGAKQLLKAESGFDNVDKEAVVWRVENMARADRVALFDGSFFLIADEFSATSDVVSMLHELDCPAASISQASEEARLLKDIDRFVTKDRNNPLWVERRKNFVDGYTATAQVRKTATTAAKRTASALAQIEPGKLPGQNAEPGRPLQDTSHLKVGADTLQQTLDQQTAAVAAHLYALVASIVLPHFTLSLLPWLLPNMHLPDFIAKIASWMHSIAFLDWGLLVSPECLVTGGSSTDSPSKNKLLRFATLHGGFWLMLLAFAVMGALESCRNCCRDKDREQSAADHVVNASIWAYLLLHAALTRSCFAALHCVGSTGVTEWFPNRVGASSLSTEIVRGSFVGHLQADPDTSCDSRAMPVTLLIASGVAVVLLVRQHALRNPLNPSDENFDENFKEVKLRKKCSLRLAVVLAALVLLWFTFYFDHNVDTNSYLLQLLSAIGAIGYGMLIPHWLYCKLLVADAAKVLNSPKLRSRYGFLYARFGAKKWGAEFRIMGRKTWLLLVTSFFAEDVHVVMVLQLLVIGYSMCKQYTEHPYAEMGSARKAFMQAHPNGDGWSRGDILEMSSLTSQMFNLLLTAMFAVNGADKGVVVVPDSVENILGYVMIVNVLFPAGYGLRIFVQECKAKKKLDSTAVRRAEGAVGDVGRGELLLTQTSNPVATA